MTDLPTSTVTFLFTDIEGSTKLWERDVEGMQAALARHDSILRETIEGHGGHVFKTVGDAFYAVFVTASDALEAALEAQRALLAQDWGRTGPLRVRMALHTGVANERGGDYFGPPLNRVARLLSAAHGGQVLLSLATQELVRAELPAHVELRDLGERRFKDLFRPERVFQLLAPDLPSSFPPLKTLDARRNNLPVQPTPLVGREKEVAEIRGQLRRADVRLVTLTGPGGTGKTRLGLQVAAELLDEFEDGVFFVELAPLSDPALVVSEVAGALGIKETGERSLTEVLRDYLRGKQVLLLLDNFEQILEAAHVVKELLVAPQVKVLATSRIALHLYGEHEYAVPPLAVPDPGRLPEPEAVSQYEAVRLFIEHARAARADFAVTDENAPAIAEICVRLDGLPLAIELAAARIKLLPPRALLTRLDNRLKLLTGGARDLPERQRTLRSAIEWSHELLRPDERMLFRRLSVFVGGHSLEAVEAVCDAGEELPLDALEGVSSLLDNSLIRQDEVSEDEPRFSMLETIREYARERLEESGEAEAIRRRHAGYFLSLAEEADPGIEGANQGMWLERLEEEHDNLRAALSWALEAEDPEAALRMGAALGEFWYLRGHFGEGRRWLEAALAKPGRSPAARARALHRVAWLAYLQGDLDRSRGASEEGLRMDGVEHFRTGGGDSLAAELQRMLGIPTTAQGNTERGRKLFEESLALSREAGSVRGAAISLFGLAVGSKWQGDFERATELYEEALALCRQSGDPALLTALLIHLGYMFMLQGDLERATALSEEAVAMLREQKHRSYLGDVLNTLAWAVLLRGDPEKARTLYEESLEHFRELGDGLGPLESLEGLACAAAARGESGRAARLFGAAEMLRDVMSLQQDPGVSKLREPYLIAARSRLDEAAWEASFAEGQAMSLEEAIEYALEEREPGGASASG